MEVTLDRGISIVIEENFMLYHVYRILMAISWSVPTRKLSRNIMAANTMMGEISMPILGNGSQRLILCKTGSVVC